ncbi:MAG TPA: T9SS type B sorting domain-containing protein [Paludibacter sp.]|nr:T9SS type B sorting domain-containing protein [Paludibacter sp.]
MPNRTIKFVLSVFFLLSLSSLHGQTTYGDTIFYESFGQHTIRVSTPYMPGGSYVFANASGSSNEKEIQDNYYAVIDPRHIADANPPSYFWTSTSPTSYTPAGSRPYYTADHTGDANGAVMVVNAGSTINYLYKRPVTLKTGFRYRFSFWIYVVARSSQFSMEVINSTINTTRTFAGPLLDREGVWTQYNLDLPVPLSSTHTTNDVIAGLQNKYSLINGNDYYIDDILLSTLHTDPVLIASLNNSPVCEGSTLNLIATPTAGASPYSYSWNGPNGFTSTDQNPALLNCTTAMNGVYSVTVTDALGQTATSATTVIVNAIPNCDFKLSTNMIDNRHNSVITEITPENGVTYLWNFGDGTTDSHPAATHAYTINGSITEFTIKLTAENAIGCTNTVSKKVDVTPFIPNVFSPNGDGVNDLFMAGYDLQVFDRYGTALYKGTSGWDGTYKGKRMDNDTYFYLINYTDKYHVVQTRKGYVTLKK